MLKLMRQHAKYFYVLFFIVILSFIFWGTGTVDQNAAEPLATIGEEVVTVQEFWRTYENMADLYRDIYGAEFDPEEMDLKQVVLNTLIEERLLLAAAREAGITVTDRELEDAIVNNPAFMRGGAFDREVYKNTLRLNGLTVAQYETNKRGELMLAKMRRLIQESVALTPQDVRGFPAGDETYKSLRETLLEAKKSAAVRAFVSGMMRRIPVTVNQQLIS